ncbi:MAG: hypothetical protein GY906_24075 [bacterium]|nr:hypothetical protein [bacterium]
MRFFLIIAVLLIVMMPALAQAQIRCAPHAAIVEVLLRKHQETIVGIGLEQGGHTVLELFTSPKGSWTIVETNMMGLSCATRAGDNWTPVLITPRPEQKPDRDVG